MSILTWVCRFCGKAGLTDLCNCEGFCAGKDKYSHDMIAERQVSAVFNCQGGPCRFLGKECKGSKYEARVPERINSKDGIILIMFEKKIGEQENFVCYNYDMFKGFPILNWVEKSYCKIIVEEKDKERVIEYLNKPLKIQLIKYYREITNSGLREAKEWSDNFMYDGNRGILPNFVNYIDLGKDKKKVRVIEASPIDIAGRHEKEDDKFAIKELSEMLKSKDETIRGIRIYKTLLEKEYRQLEEDKQGMTANFNKKIDDLASRYNKVIYFWKERFRIMVENIGEYLEH